jgi:hypothetical protein
VQGTFDELPWGYWIAATGSGALAAWILGMVPSTWMSLAADASLAAGVSQAAAPEVSDAMQLLLAVPLGAVAGLVLAYPQFLVLRRYLKRSWRWLPANALAWALGMPLVFLGAGTVAPGMSTQGIVLRVLGAIAGAGAVVGAVHGWALMRMVAGRSPNVASPQSRAPAPPEPT